PSPRYRRRLIAPSAEGPVLMESPRDACRDTTHSGIALSMRGSWGAGRVGLVSLVVANLASRADRQVGRPLLRVPAPRRASRTSGEGCRVPRVGAGGRRV